MKPIKQIFALCLFLSISFVSLAGDQPKEKTLFLELSGELKFQQFDMETGTIITDRTFLANDGFLIRPSYFVEKKIEDGKEVEYVIMSYPNFKGNGRQYDEPAVEKIFEEDKVQFIELYDNNRNPKAINGLHLAIPKSKFDKLVQRNHYTYSASVKTGALFVPFKLRPKTEGEPFTMSTDVSLGPYVGVSVRLSRTRPYFLTVPFTLGLTFVNTNDNTTSDDSVIAKEVNVVPGFSWSTGLVAELNNFNLGFITGRDYASVGSDWIYHKKQWYAFAIGFEFLRDSE